MLKGRHFRSRSALALVSPTRIKHSGFEDDAEDDDLILEAAVFSSDDDINKVSSDLRSCSRESCKNVNAAAKGHRTSSSCGELLDLPVFKKRDIGGSAVDATGGQHSINRSNSSPPCFVRPRPSFKKNPQIQESSSPVILVSIHHTMHGVSCYFTPNKAL